MYIMIIHAVVLTVYWLVFFFKQKTAYEMRISDWSSDVCSSDLAMLNVQYHAYDPAFPRSTPVLDGRWWMAGFHDDQKQAVWAFFVDQGATIPEIGRAHV